MRRMIVGAFTAVFLVLTVSSVAYAPKKKKKTKAPKLSAEAKAATDLLKSTD
ncbi:MAG: hypothetical protein JRG91_20925 [Deltaproteobacteria bacterium]|nr:hypothetical protein [Deltaproteobacteria bacterium]